MLIISKTVLIWILTKMFVIFFFLRNIISTSVAHLSCDMFHLVRLLFFDDIDGLLAEQLSRIISCIFGGHLLSIPEV